MKDEVEFKPADKYQRFLQVDTIIYVCVERHTQISKNNKFVIFMQYLKEEMSDDFSCRQV